MKTIKLTALAFAAVFSGAAAAGAGELVTTTPEVASVHAQAWNVSKLRTHSVKRYHKRKVDRRRHQAKMRAMIRKRYWGSWIQTYDRFDGFAFHGDGFRTSGQYQ